MQWTEIQFKIKTEDLEPAQAILIMASASGYYVEDYSDMEDEIAMSASPYLIDEGLLRKDRSFGVIHIFFNANENPREILEFIEERLKASDISTETTISKVDEEDWANNWKKYFKPFEIGDKLVIKPEWDEYIQQSDKRLILNINPGMAFGTGTHATTKLCLLLLEKYICDNGPSVLDIGTGSGILSIAAVLLGADTVLGVDVDAYAVRTARENALLNNVGEKARFQIGNLLNGVDNKEYDVICANIIAEVILKLAGDVGQNLTEGGIFICSGIIDEYEEEVRCALFQNGFIELDVLRDGCWAAFAVQKAAKKQRSAT